MSAKTIDIQLHTSEGSISPLSVELLGDGLCKLCEWAPMCDSAQLIPDVIIRYRELSETEFEFIEIADPGPYSAYITTLPKQIIESPELSEWTNSLVERGCQFERIFGGVLAIFYISGQGLNPRRELRELRRKVCGTDQ